MDRDEILRLAVEMLEIAEECLSRAKEPSPRIAAGAITLISDPARISEIPAEAPNELIWARRCLRIARELVGRAREVAA